MKQSIERNRKYIFATHFKQRLLSRIYKEVSIMKNKWQLGKGQFPEEMWMTQISSIPPGNRENTI